MDNSGPDGPLRVGLLDGEPAGVVCTRTAGAVDLEATLEWPEGEGGISVIGLLPDLEPAPDDWSAGGSLRESAGHGLITVTGTLYSFEEDALRSVLDDTLRAVASVATVHEAVLRTRVLRAGRPSCPSAGVVQTLARRLWAGGVRVRFGASRSLAAPGADVMLGCRGAREEVVEALAGPAGVERVSRVDRVGAAG